MKLLERSPALWAKFLDVEDLPNPSGQITDPTHGGGALNLAALNIAKNELYLPGYRVHNALTGGFVRDFKPKKETFGWGLGEGMARYEFEGNDELAFGKDGSIFATGSNEVRRMDVTGGAQPFSSIGWPFVPRLYLAHSNPHRGICVAPDGDIYVIHAFNAHGNLNSQVTQLGPDGRMKRYGFIEMRQIPAAGIAVDRDGNIYIGCTVNPKSGALPPELSSLPETFRKAYEHCYGSIIKFSPGGGHVVFDDKANELYAPQWDHGFQKFPLRVEGAEWVRPGYSNILARGRQESPVKCACRNARFAMDPSGRLYVPDSICGRVQVLDSAGNSLINIGSRGKVSEKLQFRWPETVLVGDDYCYVLDYLQGQCVQVKLGYAAFEQLTGIVVKGVN